MEGITLEAVREKFSRDRFATVNGAVIDAVDEGYAQCSMELNETHRNALGAVMGGAIFTLADFAFAVASNWNKKPQVSLNASINFLGRAKGDKLIAKAQKIKEGRATCYYEVKVSDELGNQVAHMTSGGFVL
ncbi:MAG: PaaI family thioesterase [Lachnospiraceae bacterium]|nr:PaaI family thioesterase [Lachnospiraceae bacterium]